MEWLVGIYLIGVIITWIFLYFQPKPSHLSKDQYILSTLFDAVLWPILISLLTIHLYLIYYFNKPGD